MWRERSVGTLALLILSAHEYEDDEFDYDQLDCRKVAINGDMIDELEYAGNATPKPYMNPVNWVGARFARR
jgi:hypothetical protein